jgi:hypothetical protein
MNVNFLLGVRNCFSYIPKVVSTIDDPLSVAVVTDGSKAVKALIGSAPDTVILEFL